MTRRRLREGQRSGHGGWPGQWVPRGNGWDALARGRVETETPVRKTMFVSGQEGVSGLVRANGRAVVEVEGREFDQHTITLNNNHPITP